MINKLVDLREEWEDMSPKIDRIGTFVNSEEFNNLPPKDKAICAWAYKVMRNYHNALREIITTTNNEGINVSTIKED